MESKINKQLEIIKESNKWVLDSLQNEKQKNAYFEFVNFRRKLKKKKFAMESNPAAAIYGESQVGKSYLVSSLLSLPEQPFGISDKGGVFYNFIEDINPPGGGSESTSLVSRFSIDYKPINLQYPVKARLMSPADIVLVLCDSFYNDIKATHNSILQTNDIDDIIRDLKVTYQSGTLQQNVFEEDDILDICDYITNNFRQKAGNILNSKFFDEVPFLIAKIKPSEWKNIFSLLWNKNNEFSNLFNNLITEYAKLNFTETLYLPIEAILYKHGTILDVERLKEIYNVPKKIEPDYKAETTVIYFENGAEKEIKSFPKTFLCALSAELIFSQPESLLLSKPLLANIDLLDFPGARARKTSPENMINQEAMPDLLLRGKVAYLFNKYSDTEIIKILIFCTKHDQAGERTMPELLNHWISNIVGDSPDKRETFINKSKIPPLFIIETWFNVNLQYDPQRDKINDNASLNYRWNQRFDRTLAGEKVDTKIYDWFENWTTTNPVFQNIFLLRDFDKSDEYSSKLFKGYRENKKEIEEVKNSIYPNFRNDLRQSFLEYDFVKRHFESPTESWDKAASINEDGTRLIIDKLTIAAKNINDAHLEKAIRDLNAISQGILEELKKYFHDSESNALLQKAKSTAGSIQANLDIVFGKNPYFFGQMMKILMIDESAVYNLYLEKIRDIERHDVVNMDKYSAIRMNVPELNVNDNYDSNLERLRVHYEKATKEQCKADFAAEGIDLDELFYGNNERVKNFSQVLAESLETFWFEQYMQENKQSLSGVLSDSDLSDIQDLLKRLFKKLRISKVVADKIRRYVDGHINIEDVYEMIANISTEIINKFINTVGLEYFTESDFNDLKLANEKNNLGLILEHEDLQFKQNSPAEAADLITIMGNLPELLNQNPLPIEAIKSLPNYRNYKLWYDLLKVGFVSVCDIPNYDIQSNNKLKEIIDECSTIKY